MSEDDRLTLRLMGDMPPDLLHFLKEKVTTFVKFDLIRFFHENQFTFVAIDTVSHYVGHDDESVARAVEALVADGVLETTTMDGMQAYSLAKEHGTRSTVGDFVEACEDATFRTKVIFHIIRGMR